MATTLVITCPECSKQMKASSDLEGKKVRCKGCGHTFPVRAPASAKTGPAKGKADAKAAAAKPAAKHDEDDEYGKPNPYAITNLDLTPRCPHCAKEMESREAIICIYCGYNTQTRFQVKLVKTIDHTAMDWTLHLGMAVFCILLAFGFVGAIVFLLTAAKAILEDYPEEWWNFGIEATRVWGTVFCLACIFFCVRFAIKRLIFNPRPPEKVKH